jgi:excisionase family DNA binding protein
MKRDVRAPVIRLLTVPQAADQLGLTRSDVERLVETGDLHAVNVSPHGGRRFWPADVDACGLARAGMSASTAIATAPPVDLDAAQPAITTRLGERTVAADPPHRARIQLELTPRHPRWPRFELAQERTSSNYLAFRDAEHVTAYVRARATLELDASNSVHSEPLRDRGVLV